MTKIYNINNKKICSTSIMLLLVKIIFLLYKPVRIEYILFVEYAKP